MLWEFNRFLAEKPCQTGTLVKRSLLRFIDVDFSQVIGVILPPHHPFFKETIPTLVSTHAVASAALSGFVLTGHPETISQSGDIDAKLSVVTC